MSRGPPGPKSTTIHLWGPIASAYSAIAPTPVVALNRAVAVGEVGGPQAGLDALEGLEAVPLYFAVRADLLRRLGRDAEALEAYDAAIGRAATVPEREFLARRRASLS